MSRGTVRAVILTALVSITSPVLANQSDPEPENQVQLDEDNLLVIEVSVETLPVADSLFVFQTPDTTMIPLQGLFDALDFPLDIDLDAQTIDGWFINEQNLFSLDLYNQTLFIRGQRQVLPNNLSFGTDDFDLYVNYQALEQWFGLKLDLDVSQLTLSITSDTPLPIVQKLAREEKRKKIKKLARTDLPDQFLQNEYDWFGRPVFDVELSLEVENDNHPLDNNDHVTTSKSTVIQGGMDLLKHSMSSSYVNTNGKTEVRMTLSRASSRPDSSMWFGLNEYKLGDITSHTSPLLFSSVKGSGVHLKRGGSAILDQTSDILIEGDAPPGWEVELYRNGSLVEFSNANDRGQYSFQNIPTFVGENIFDIRIYGPQGQYRTERKQITVGAGMIPAGAWEYQAYALNRNRNVISSDSDSLSEDSPFFLTEVSYGLNESVTLQLGTTQFKPSDSGEERNYQYLNLFGSISGSLAQFRIANDSDSGTAISSELKGRIYDTNFNASITKFNELISDQNTDGLLDIETDVRFNGVTRLLTSTPISYDIEVKQTQFLENGLEQLFFSKRLSGSWGQTLLAHELRVNNTNAQDVENQLGSTISGTRRLNNWRLKVQTDYNIEPQGKFEGLSLGATYQRTKAFTYQGTVDYRLLDGDEFAFNNTFTWNLDSAAVSINAGFSSEDRQFLGLNLSTSLGYDPVRKSMIFTKNNLASSASVTAHTFVDENNNGFQEDHEPSMQGVTFTGRSEWRHLPTDENGETTLTGIPNLDMQRIQINESSIEDPFLAAKVKEHYIYTHSARHSKLQFTLVPMLEVEGEIYLYKEGKDPRPAFGSTVLLIDSTNEVVARTTTEYDGIFLFEGILPGNYQLRLEKEYLAKQGVSTPPFVEFSTENSDGVVYIDPIQLHVNK